MEIWTRTSRLDSSGNCRNGNGHHSKEMKVAECIVQKDEYGWICLFGVGLLGCPQCGPCLIGFQVSHPLCRVCMI